MSSANSEQLQAEETSYAPISKAAIVAILLAAFSSGGVFTVMLWFLGPMAIAVALISLYTLQRHRGTLRGRWLAISALAIASFFSGWGGARFQSHQWWIYQHAEQYTEDWLGWVEQGKLTQAYTYARASGAANPVTGAVDPQQGRMFFEQEPLITLRSGKGKLYLRQRAGILEGGNQTIVTLVYEYRIREGQLTRNVPIIVEVNRRFQPNTGRYDWCISNIQ